ncbi:MAG TPA: intradiol ring-cleavage dioxygenase [Thermomicrobiales bacterium]|nr:intradiol ring-cleavage dioxygenase [Thermomicrobiales bacterium]
MTRTVSPTDPANRRDPAPPGRPSRRDLLRAGAGGVALGVARFAPERAAAQTAVGSPVSCVLAPEMTEGPYYLPLDLVRQDLTEGKPGLPLRLRIAVMNTQGGGCAPLAGAAVDLWHCDAQGVYSGISGENPGGGGAATGADNQSTTFLRGIQLTGADGVAAFDTIYPGWYQGRAVHIHMKVHVGGDATGATPPADGYDGGHVAHTGQLFFDDALSDQVFGTAAYANRDNAERTRNGQDGILGDHGDEPGVMLVLTPVTPGALADGFDGTVIVGVDAGATPGPASFGGGQGGPSPGGPTAPLAAPGSPPAP